MSFSASDAGPMYQNSNQVRDQTRHTFDSTSSVELPSSRLQTGAKAHSIPNAGASEPSLYKRCELIVGGPYAPTAGSDQSRNNTWVDSAPAASLPHPLSQGPSPSHTPDVPLDSQQPSSMLVAPPMYYDPDHTLQTAQNSEPYEQWVMFYNQNHGQAQGQQSWAGQETQSVPVSQLHNLGHVPYQQHQHNHSTLPLNGGMQQPAQNQYNFVQSHYAPQDQQMNGVYGQTYVPNMQAHIQQPVTRPVRRLPRTSNASANVQQQVPSIPNSMFNFQSQQPQHYAQQLPNTAAGMSYYQPGVTQNGHRTNGHDFSFSFDRVTPEHSVPASSNSGHTPNSENMPLSSVSPSSWQEADDGQTQAYTANTSGQSFIAAQAPPSAPSKRPRQKSNAHKRRKTQPPDESESSEEDDDPVSTSGVPPLRGPNLNPARLPGACTHCKKLKMKCDFPKDVDTCKRCRQTGHTCIVEGRKPRNTPNKREYLLAQIREKDQIIESLLKQLHNPYLATPMSVASFRQATSPADQNNQNVLRWLGRLEHSVQTAGGSTGLNAFTLEYRERSAEGTDDEQEGEQEGDGEPTERGSVATQRDIAGQDEGTSHLPSDTVSVPIGLIADLSLQSNKRRGTPREVDDNDDDNVGVASKMFFMPGPATNLNLRKELIEQHSPPDIVVHGLVTPDDVNKLFKIFFERLSPHVSILDPELHTPSSTFSRCPFLFTVVCAIASRYYTDRSEIYPIAMHFAKHAAANALITGWKSVELAQAYILLSVYSVPPKRWEDDRGWLYTGLAIRIATDLNLHQMSNTRPTTERQEREMINKLRIWMNCYNLDRSTATQFGKPSTIKEDAIIRKSDVWYKMSQYNHKFDIGLCAYTSLLRITSRFYDEIHSNPDSTIGLNQNLNFREVIFRYDAQLSAFYEEWTRRFTEESDMNDPSLAFRAGLAPFFTNYSRLVMYSFGFQQAYRRGIESRDQIFVDKCFQAAKDVISAMVERVAPTGFMRYAPDSHFVFGTFAAAFLLKLLKPEFAKFLTKDKEDEIFQLIQRLIQTLQSPEVAIDERHTPRLHARFLAGLVSRHRRDVSTSSRTQHPQQPPPSQLPVVATTSSSSAQVSGETTGDQQTYSTASAGGAQQGMEHTSTNTAMSEPLYQPASAYTQQGYYSNASSPAAGSSDDEMLGVLRVLKTPTYWDNMMMPGFQWSNDIYQQGIPGIHGLNNLPVAEIPLS